MKKIKISQEDLINVMFYSFRYALGRNTYAVSDVVDVLTKYIDLFSVNDLKTIHKEIKIQYPYNTLFKNKDSITNIYEKEWLRIVELLESKGIDSDW
jgi:hypothetical protein